MEPRLFVILLGGKPPGCTIEQHNVFFGVGTSLEEFYPAIKAFWPAAPKIHIDAYMIVEQVGDYDITPRKKGEADGVGEDHKLFFVNLGGYHPGVFEEFHKKLLIVAVDEAAAEAAAEEDSFFEEGIKLHVDDKQALEEFGDDAPLEVGAWIEPQGFVLCLEKVRSGSSAYPEPVITGYHKVP